MKRNIPTVKQLETYPDEFTCSMSKELMVNPVLLENGFSYERSVIEEIMNELDDDDIKEAFGGGKILDNHTLKSAILTYREEEIDRCLELMNNLNNSNNSDNSTLLPLLRDRIAKLHSPLGEEAKEKFLVAIEKADAAITESYGFQRMILRRDLKELYNKSKESGYEEDRARYQEALLNLRKFESDHSKKIVTPTSQTDQSDQEKREAEKAKLIAKANKLKEDPAEFTCIISGELMQTPTITQNGHSYEYESISEWLKSHNTDPQSGLLPAEIDLTTNQPKIDPKTKAPVINKKLILNETLLEAIIHYRLNSISECVEVADQLTNLGEYKVAMELVERTEELRESLEEELTTETNSKERVEQCRNRTSAAIIASSAAQNSVADLEGNQLDKIEGGEIEDIRPPEGANPLSSLNPCRVVQALARESNGKSQPQRK